MLSILLLSIIVLIVLGVRTLKKAKKTGEITKEKAYLYFKIAGVCFIAFIGGTSSSLNAFIGLISMVLIFISLVWLIVSLIRKKEHKKSLYLLIVSVLMFFSQISLVSTVPNTDDSKKIEVTKEEKTAKGNEEKKEKEKIEIPDFSTIDATEWCNQNNFKLNKKESYSDEKALGEYISQYPEVGAKVIEGSSITVTYSKGHKPTAEETNALAKAISYYNKLYMSKSAIYEQLTSPYGEGFTAEAAQYAIDNIADFDFKYNALEKAKNYQSKMNMSRSAIYEQLTSSYGEGFTAEEAQYAIDNLPQ